MAGGTAVCVPMSETGTTRSPVEIIFVPPPAGPGMPSERIRNIVGACVIGSVLCLGLIVARGWGLAQWALIMTPLLLAVSVIVAVFRWRVNRAHLAQRQAFLDKHPTDEARPAVAALAKAWKMPDRMPKLEDVRAALSNEMKNETAGRAVIVCFGEPDVPEVGQVHFEPQIVAPTEAVWRQLIWLVIAGMLAGWLLLDFLRVLPPRFPGARSLLGGFMYFFVAGAIALVVWVWRAALRPTYLRMAPGVIQVLEYHYRRSKPIIRSYPVTAGTLVVFTRIGKSLTVTLSRGQDKDMLHFSRMRQPQQWVEWTWRALLSTAPTPPLSDDELLG
jgi:hypothetical protein